jgi:NADPH-dependent 2,4-dienoyl-CoA reductase/sulfur reductase-like enzyme/rhodanese-related sulfurtransferase
MLRQEGRGGELKVVVVGGVAGGMSFAARARRLCEDCSIVVMEKGPYVSFANCGLPYYLSGEIADRNALLLHTPDSLRLTLDLDVRVQHEVVAIDRANKIVTVRDVANDRTYEESFDRLVLSTGATAFLPPVDGAQSERIHVLRTVPDVDRLRERVAELQGTGKPAVVVGAGFIGLEVVESLRHSGIAVVLVELSDQVLPPLDAEMARAVEEELIAHEVDLRLQTSVALVANVENGIRVDLTDGTAVDAGMVLMAVGVRTENTLARDAGLDIDDRGGVITDEFLRTSDESIYAVGDVIEVTEEVSGHPALVPLAGPANRQGRTAANHMFGRAGERTPVLATAIVRIFERTAATTGRSQKALLRDGVKFHAVHLHPNDHAGYFPGARPIHLKVLFGVDGRVLGAQATGAAGVDKRIDVLATAIRAGMTVHDIADLELAYAPPYGSAKDPINMAGFIGENVLDGTAVLWSAAKLSDLTVLDGELLDVRSADEFRAGHLRGAINIPHTELRARVDEIPEGRPLFVYCAAGFRSYLATRALRQKGWSDVRSLDGGLQTLLAQHRSIELVKE